MMTYRCAERGCQLTEADTKKMKCPTCRHPMNVVMEEVADPTPPAPPAPPPSPEAPPAP